MSNLDVGLVLQAGQLALFFGQAARLLRLGSLDLLQLGGRGRQARAQLVLFHLPDALL